MKKILAILFLSFLWFGTTSADIYEPGKNNFNCAIGGLDAYKEAQDFKRKNPKDNTVVYLSCNDGRWSWNWIGGEKLKSIHKKSFNECKKNSKARGTGECFLFSTNDLIVWEFSDSNPGSIELLKKTYTKKFGENFYPTKEESKTAGCMEGNCSDGKGTMQWSNGDKYTGEWKNGITHGQGTMQWSNGDRYTGEWKNGKPNGQGTMQWASGDEYVGVWKDGFRVKKKFIPEKELRTRKKYVFKNIEILKKIIKPDDPTNFIELKFIREGKNLRSPRGQPSNRRCPCKDLYINFDGYIYHAYYKNVDHKADTPNSVTKIEIVVNKDYKDSAKAKKHALKYAKLVGQLPAFLRDKGIKRIVIHPGKRRWVADRGSKEFVVYPSSDWYEPILSLIHEAAHITVDNKIIHHYKWKEAVATDGKYITEYARSNENEDSAETITFWVALRCSNISKGKKKRILKSIPNRIKFLDEMNFKTDPMVCEK
tara:strand:- start:122 stop:1564 length:1443 start_codon:yes stop_codon:yes gene_type:complete